MHPGFMTYSPLPAVTAHVEADTVISPPTAASLSLLFLFASDDHKLIRVLNTKNRSNQRGTSYIQRGYVLQTEGLSRCKPMLIQ